jgi:hypothetical protein
MLKKYGEIFTVILAMILLMFFLCSCGPKGSETIAQTSEEESATESTETENTENYGDVPEESGIDGETQEEPFEEEEEEATEEEQEEEEEHPYPEFFEIRLLTGLGARYFEGAWDELLIEEKYNVDLKVWNINNNDEIGLTKMLAAGEYPDVGLLPGCPLTPKELHDEGYIRTVPLSIISEHFPFYYDKMYQNSPWGPLYNRVGNSEAYYGLSVIDNSYLLPSRVPLVRLDWLENTGHGISEEFLTPLILTNESETEGTARLYITNAYPEYIEWNEIFKAFAVEDPDLNGINDTIAAYVWPFNERNLYADLFTGQFGIIASDDQFLYRDFVTGDVVPYFAHSSYKEYMRWMTDMRKLGYVKTGPTPADERALQSLWAGGKVGIMSIGLSSILSPADEENAFAPWKGSDDTAVYVIFPAIKGPEREFGTKRLTLEAMSEEKGKVFTFGSEVSDEKLIRIFTIWNDCFSDPYSEFSYTLSSGIEGIHYVWSDVPFKSPKITVPEDKVPNRYKMGGFWLGNYFGVEDYFEYPGKRDLLFFIYKSKWTKKYTVEPYKIINPRQMGALYEKYLADYDAVKEAVEEKVRAFEKRVWNYEIKDFNAAWDTYMAELYEAGLGSIVEKYYNSLEFPSYTLPDFNSTIRSFKGLK